MTYVQRFLPYATGLTGVILIALSIQAMSTKPNAAWTSTSIAFFLVLLVGGLWVTLRERSDIFAHSSERLLSGACSRPCGSRRPVLTPCRQSIRCWSLKPVPAFRPSPI